MKNHLLRVTLSFLVISLGGLNIVSAQISGDTFAKALETKKANLTYIYSEAPGFAANQNGKVQGVCVDIMNDFEFFLLDKYGITVNSTMNKQHANNFTDYLNTVKASKNGVFGLSNTTITEKRKKEYSFSPPYITNIAMILTHKDVPTLESLDRIAEVFEGKTALTIKGTTNEEQILKIKANYIPNLKIEYVNYFDEAMVKIDNSTDYFTNVDFTYYLSALNNKKSIKRHPAGDQTAEKFGIIMPKNSDWVKPFNEFLTTAYETSSSYRKIIALHLGPNALKLLDAVTAK
ncbi:transporter substrate-binding domain-containing protein [Marivirga sp. S37H4]|uniref:Transporter substrate-binding domain-containing protein n=1 Tax=Marivirga aurantiaca TaxID=2802615 RepID=A0A934WZQ6_9BACT|nr:transporter substrate-binding domain-containing protein [Marivirga aurantiaca]MBK6265862.1 transporter substrate-binding domain-containing protein [Marivirga aurantiaca]